MGKELTTATAAPLSFDHIERMANAVAKSGMFSVKTPEGALTLMLIAQSEGIHPAQAMMDYDLIQGKPALKTASMLARFQRSGGKVKWLESSDAKVSGEFSHPAGGTLVVTWDNERLKTAGLAGKEMHNKFPMQMKRARCISEAVRAIAPQCNPTNLYTVEETQDMVDVTPAPVSQAEAVFGAANALTQEERDEHVKAIATAGDMPALTVAFAAAWEHGKQAKDRRAQDLFKVEYDSRKQALTTTQEVI